MKIKWGFMMMVILALHPVIIMGSVAYATPQMVSNYNGVGPDARTGAAVVLYYDPYAGVIGCTHWVRG